MKSMRVWLVAALAVSMMMACVVVRADDEDVEADEDATDVVILTDNNFAENVLEGGGDWLIKFYAPWCGHCKRLAPVWDEAATELLNTLNIAKVDCTQHSMVCGEYGVRGYPTLKFFRDGEPHDYASGRTLEDILGFAETVTSDAVVQVEALSELKDAEVAFVFTGEMSEALHTFAHGLQPTGVKFAQAPAAAVEGVGADTLVVVKDGAVTAYEGDLADTDAVAAWVEAEKLPLVPALTAYNFRKLTAGGATLVGVVDPRNRKDMDRYLDVLREAAAPFDGEFQFTWVDGVQWPNFVGRFGVGWQDIPTAFVLDAEYELYYTADKLKTPQDVSAFVAGVQSGAVSPKTHSMLGPLKVYWMHLSRWTATTLGVDMWVIGLVGAGVALVALWMSLPSLEPEKVPEKEE